MYRDLSSIKIIFYKIVYIIQDIVTQVKIAEFAV